MPNATGRAGMACADLTTFCRLDELGPEVTGQRLESDRAVLACRMPRRIGGAVAAAKKAVRGTASPGRWPMNLSAGGPPPWWSRSAATGAQDAPMCGAKWILRLVRALDDREGGSAPTGRARRRTNTWPAIAVGCR